MKRILILSLAYFPQVGGAEVAIKEITDRIAPGDLEFHMITHRFDPRALREERAGNVLVHRIGSGSSRLSKFFFQFSAARAALVLDRELHFDAAWAVMAHSSGVPAALFKMRRPHTPLLLTLQEGDPPRQIEHTMLPLWPLFSRAFMRADAVQSISNFLADWARRRGAKGTIEVVPNGVDLSRFMRAWSEEELVELRRALGKRAGDRWLVTASRLVAKNGLDAVVRALPQIADEVIFAVAGAGPEASALRKLARSLGVEHRIRFLGHVSQEDLPGVLAISDIFIRPSRSEGQGIAFIEAMAAGLPVIATQAGGIGDFLFDAKKNPDTPPTGFAVGVDAPAEIAAQVKFILAHPSEAAAVVANAKALIARDYDWDKIAGRMRDLFAKIGA